MTIRHTAALFSASGYINVIRAEYGAAGTLDLLMMREDCRRRVDKLSVEAQHLLECFRFDQEWFSDEEPAPELWSIVRLVEICTTVTGLSSTHVPGYLVLEQTLIDCGWENTLVKRLISGRNWSDLYAAYNDPVKLRLPEMGVFMAGWLSLADCAEFLGWLSDLPSPVSGGGKGDIALSDAKAMLGSAVENKKELLLILD